MYNDKLAELSPEDLKLSVRQSISLLQNAAVM